MIEQKSIIAREGMYPKGAEFVQRRNWRKSMVSMLKVERVKRGITHIDLWMKSGVPQWRISLIERGISPKPNEAKKITKALGLDEQILFPVQDCDHTGALRD